MPLTGPYSVAKGMADDERSSWHRPDALECRYREGLAGALDGSAAGPAEIVRSVAHRLDPNIPLELITRAADAESRWRKGFAGDPLIKH